ncbi:MAG: DnaJ domain-containing protein [Giesbergeria sp.]
MPKNALARVLLDFGRTPGRYALRLREPAELHAQIDTLALWALGRVPEGLQAQAQEIKAAAVMFIQRACFAPENNHYQILGLPQGPVDAELLRTRYRALIRLTHPDMGVEGLPANAAGLVNRAQKVLADPALRERYDQELENEAWPRWRTAPPVAGAASAPFARKPEAHWAAPKSRLGGGEGWSALWARYPLQARLLLTATGVGALVVALLAWAANDTPGGAMLVVARAPSGGSAKPDAARPAKPQAAERARAGQPGAAPASSAAQSLDCSKWRLVRQCRPATVARHAKHLACYPPLAGRPRARQPAPTGQFGQHPCRHPSGRQRGRQLGERSTGCGRAALAPCPAQPRAGRCDGGASADAGAAPGGARSHAHGGARRP